MEITSKIRSMFFCVVSDHIAFTRCSSGSRTPEKAKNHCLYLYVEKTEIALKEFLMDMALDILPELQTAAHSRYPTPALGCVTGIPDVTYPGLGSRSSPLHLSLLNLPQLQSSTCSNRKLSSWGLFFFHSLRPCLRAVISIFERVLNLTFPSPPAATILVWFSVTLSQYVSMASTLPPCFSPYPSSIYSSQQPKQLCPQPSHIP